MKWRSGVGTALVLLSLSCARDEPLLAVDRFIGSTPQALEQRLGTAPQSSRPEGKDWGFLRWKDINGVNILAVVQQGKVSYVTYEFAAMEPFDEAAALGILGITPPKEAPSYRGKGQIKRWQPYRAYTRLTINPATRLVSVGHHPWADNAAGGEEDQTLLPGAQG